MSQRVRLELELVLPEAPDVADACVARLQAILGHEPGVTGVHLVGPPRVTAPVLCHYDPKAVSLARLREVATGAGARLAERYGHVTAPIHAVAAEDAAPRIETSLRAISGVLEAAVNLPAQVASVEFDRTVTNAAAVVAALGALGLAVPSDVPSAGAAEGAEGAGDDGVVASGTWYARNEELAWSLCAGALLAAGVAGERWVGISRGVAIALFVGAYGFGGFDLVRHNVENLRKGGFRFDIDLLMLEAATGAAALGEWAEGAFLLFLFALAHALEHYALDRARHAIRALGELAPRVAR